jgi:vanillate O-demethylase monooxygenase subunit
VSDKPRAVELLGERLVLFRLSGRVVCFRDLCIHRGSPLSLGRVQNGHVVCAYHGWEYDADGSCVRIPALPATRAIPAKARAQVFKAQERHGLVWVCLGEPRADIPEFPEFSDSTYQFDLVDPFVRRCTAARAIENFVDQAHFPFVHAGILGDPAHPEVPDVETFVRVGEELRFAWDAPPNALEPVAHRRTYRITRPFTIHQRKIHIGTGDTTLLFFTVTPNNARVSTLHLYYGRNFTSAMDPERERAAVLLIAEQDKPIIENQRPEELPLDLAAELHIKGPDAIAVEYRRFMAELGMNVDAPPV